MIYVAIDGVAPRAKTNQQRNRRFMAVLEEESKQLLIFLIFLSEIKVPLEDPDDIMPFYLNKITPGTELMDKVLFIFITFRFLHFYIVFLLIRLLMMKNGKILLL